MVAANVANHGVLHGIQILKFVDEHAVPASTDALHDLGVAEQLGCLEDEHVEVDEIPRVEKIHIALEDLAVARVFKGRAAEAVRGEAREEAAVPAWWDRQPAQDDALLPIVDDAEAALETDARTELAQQLGAEGVDGSRLDRRGAIS